MTRERFDRQLQLILDQVLVLGSMVEQSVQNSLEALKRRDLGVAQRIYIEDQRINEKRYSIEGGCVTPIATQQPMARDVRFWLPFSRLSPARAIGDYAKGISKIPCC
jgi:phosphate transport system protein